MPAIFLDTTIQVDRIIQEHDEGKRAAIEALLAQYDFKAACTYSLVEFKRVVLQNLSLCLAYLIEEGSYFLALNRVTGLGPRRGRRISTLISIMSWVGINVNALQKVDAHGDLDELLTLQSISYIRTNIFFLWKRFEKSVDTLFDGTKCARAREKPRRDGKGNVIVQIRESLCANMECTNTGLMTSLLPVIQRICSHIDQLETKGEEVSQELKTARDELRLAIRDRTRLYNYNNCLKIGDVWLHLESLFGGVKEFGTTNYKESRHLCPPMVLMMKDPYIR